MVVNDGIPHRVYLLLVLGLHVLRRSVSLYLLVIIRSRDLVSLTLGCLMSSDGLHLHVGALNPHLLRWLCLG